MLQDHQRELAALTACQTSTPTWHTPDELAAAADALIAAMRAHRDVDLGARLHHELDARVRTGRLEYLDRDDFPDARKLVLVHRLHLLNLALRSYRVFYAALRPLLLEVFEATRRPVRVLELACGYGEFSLQLAALAGQDGLPVEVCGSDINAAYVASAQDRAERRGLPTRFLRLNAFDLGLPERAYDIVFIAQSMHHFGAGQLARMIAQARRVATTAMVGIDGRRSLSLLVALPALAALALNYHGIHDAWVTARKLYSEIELQAIARLAAPGAAVSVRALPPLFSLLLVRG